jgi:putative ABC transport system permease protein
MLDSMDMAVYMRYVLDKAVDSFTNLLVIICFISVLFCALLIINVLKNRTYDIGVLRARGMAKTKIAFFLSCEVFIVAITSFLAAFALYITAFASVANSMYNFQFAIVGNDQSFWSNFTSSSANAAREYEFALSVYPYTLLYGIIIVAVFTFAVGFAAILFISRHEPMKTMTRY